MRVTVCGVPHEMSIVDGGVLFSDKSGFYGVTKRIMFTYRSDLWYVVEATSTFDNVALCHLVRMHKLLAEHIGGDHEVRQLRFREVDRPAP